MSLQSLGARRRLLSVMAVVVSIAGVHALPALAGGHGGSAGLDRVRIHRGHYRIDAYEQAGYRYTVDGQVATIIEATPPRALAWKGRILVPGLFDVSHHFEIDPLADGHSRLRQLEAPVRALLGSHGAVHARCAWRHASGLGTRRSRDQATRR